MTVKNLTEDNISVLMALCLGYAKISIKYAKEENKDSLWYSHMLRVDDVLNANPKKAKSEQSILYIGSKITDAVRLDISYFQTKKFSAYLCSLFLLEFLFQTKKNIKINSKFRDIDFIALRSGLEKGQYAEAAKDTDIFVAKILDMLQIEVSGDDQVKIEKPKVEQKKRGRKKKNEENK